MTDKPEHSPLPWRDHLVDDTLIVDANGRAIAQVADKTDAPIIVTAVNSHAAAMRALAFASSVIKGGESWSEECERIIGGAIAAGRGEA